MVESDWVKKLSKEKIQPIDILVALIPVALFIYPVVYFFVLVFNLLELNVALPLFIVLCIILLFIDWIIWSKKLRNTLIPTLKGFILSSVDIGVLFIILFLLSTLEMLKGTNQVLWEIFTGFISVVLISALADLHELSNVYRSLMESAKKRIYYEIKT